MNTTAHKHTLFPTHSADESAKTALVSDLSETEISLFRNLLVERTGLIMDGHRSSALYRAIEKGIQTTASTSHTEYYNLLQRTETESDVWEDLIDLSTVSETYFFRNSSHMDALRNHILPAIIERRRDTRQIRIWSAGCASGEEPYTLAVLLCELIPDIDNWHVCILGTDINKGVLHRAHNGLYGKASFRKTTKAQRARYFSPDRDQWAVQPRLQKLVTFAYLNLSEPLFPSLATNTTALDLILCRNVAIYLPEAVIRTKAERFHQCLLNDGWLLMGAAETNTEIYSEFKATNFKGCTAYQKVGRRAAIAQPERHTGATRVPAIKKSSSRSTPLSRRDSRNRISASYEPAPSAARTRPKKDVPTDNLFEAGVACMAQGEYDDAVPLFKEHARHNAADAATCSCHVAVAYANSGRLRDAESACKDAIKVDPLMLEAYFTLSMIYQEEAEWNLAAAQLKKSIYLEPEFLMGHCGLASNYAQLGLDTDAERHRAQAVRLAARMPSNDSVPLSGGMNASHVMSMLKML